MREQQARGTEVSTSPAVLVIDDEANNLDIVYRALHKDFHVHLAHSAAEGLRLLSSVQVAVIIADQRMPEMTGVEFLQQAIARQPAAKRLLLTAYADIDAIVHAVNLGKIHHFVQKPFDPASLRATVSQLTQLSDLESTNSALVEELRVVIEKLREKEAMLARNLDERERELMRVVEELKANNEILQQLALRDGLTGLYNHRSFHQRLREEVARARRTSGCLSLIMADVDHFKRVNDQHGHPAGDAVLKFIGGMLSGATPNAPPTRKTDLVARYGGEEFAIILLDTAKEGAAIRAERLRESFAAMDSGILGGESISMSFGVAAYPDDALEADELIAHADDALLRAKSSGRNQVAIWAHRNLKTRSVLRPFTEVQSTLVSALRRDRSLSLISMRLTDLARLERHYGRSGARATGEAFCEIALSEVDDLVPPDSLVAVISSDPDHVQTFVRLPTDISHQIGPRYLEQISERLSARVEVQLQERLEKSGLGLARVVSGHATQLLTPTVAIERQIDRLAQDASTQVDIAADVRRGRDKLEIQRLILENTLRAMMQPIFGGASTQPIGFEALARGPSKSPLESPIVMLDLAEDVDLITELDLCMVRAGFAAAKHLPKDSLFFLNLLPTTLSNAAFFRDELPRMVQEAGLISSRVVLELSERQSADHGLFMKALEKLRGAGFVLGLDDLGTQNANLAEIAAFRPEWLKLDRSLIRHVHLDPVKRDLIGAIVSFARKQGSRIVAEGIETAEEYELLKKLDVDYFQGFLLGRPAYLGLSEQANAETRSTG